MKFKSFKEAYEALKAMDPSDTCSFVLIMGENKEGLRSRFMTHSQALEVTRKLSLDASAKIGDVQVAAGC